MLDRMAFRGPFAAGLIVLGVAVASLGALGASGCGGTSVEHVGGGGTGGGGHGGSGGSTAGTASAGTGGSAGAPCTTVGSYAGPEYVDWTLSPDLSCEGMEVFCYDVSEPVLGTCIDGGIDPPGTTGHVAPPAPPKFDCPNVRTLCSKQIGCCESIYTFVAGPQVRFDAPNTPPCCYLAQPGFNPR
jgi:hypothetical protein